MVGEEADFLREEEKHCQSHGEWKNKTRLFFVSQSFSHIHILTLPFSLSFLSLSLYLTLKAAPRPPLL